MLASFFSKHVTRKLSLLGLCAAMLLTGPLSSGVAQAKETGVAKEIALLTKEVKVLTKEVSELSKEISKDKDSCFDPFSCAPKEKCFVPCCGFVGKKVDCCDHFCPPPHHPECRSPECPPCYCFYKPDKCFHSCDFHKCDFRFCF